MRNLPLSFRLEGAAQTEQFGEALGDILSSASAHPGAIVVLLSGDLGAGKTTLVRGLAVGLGADCDAVASPTFTIRMDHRGRDRTLVHIDAWRIGQEDLESIGFEELLDTAPSRQASSAGPVVAIEWPERIAEALPGRHIRIRLEHAAAGNDGEIPIRVITIDASGCDEPEARRIAEGLSVLVRAARMSPPACPVCGQTPTGESSPDAPFCSKRCRMADLGDWLAMRHRIEGSDVPEFDE